MQAVCDSTLSFLQPHGPLRRFSVLVKGGTVSEESKASTGSQVWEEVFLSPQEGEAGLPHGAGP